MSKEISFESLCEQLEPISIEFLVDYSLEDSEDNLGALSPFIIDVDIDTTTACLPSAYNGLGYKNLIKMEFLLAAFAKKIEKCGNACIPLLLLRNRNLICIHRCNMLCGIFRSVPWKNYFCRNSDSFNFTFCSCC